jgi:PBSX family phage terminase large subunit
MLKATIVFEKNWSAIHDVNEDGTRKWRYIVNTGSSRSSKTFSIIDCLDLYAREQQDKRLTIWRDTKTDCRKTVLVDVLKHLKVTGRYKVCQDFNKTESIFTYTNGSTLEIHGTDDEETVHGLTQSVAHFNEPYKISKDTFDQIDQRTSDFILIDWNPKKTHWIMDIIKDPRTIVIHSTFQDNPFCPEESKAKILSYQSVNMSSIVVEKILTEQEAKNYDIINNPLNISPGRINELMRCRDNEYKNSASEFNWNVYGLGLKAEQPNRIFNWTEIPYSVYNDINAPIYTGCDWGSVDPWGIVDAKYYDGGLYLHERNYLSENEIRMKLTSTELAQVMANDEGLVSWMFKKLNIPFDRPVICDNNRNSKIRALRIAGWDYAQPASKLPGSIIDGISLLLNLKVYFTSDSINLKYEQENYSRKVDRYGIVLEEPEDANNHIAGDPPRYIAMYLQQQGIIKKI